VHSVAGRCPTTEPLVELPPFQDPHHTGDGRVRRRRRQRHRAPGAASLAHRGVLFLDEAPEFPARVLDALRSPSRAAG
jgi:magnesium chelatase family protein